MAVSARNPSIPRAKRGRCIAAAVVLALSPLPFAAFAAGDAIPLAGEVVPAPAGFEAASAKYHAVRPTDIYISPFIWGGKVKGVHFDAGQPLEILAKPKGYDWLLVGKNGTGIGYVPLANVAPTKQ